ncbi:MAG: NUDIX domain-containing protein [Parcubacteria group bacterium]|jgi:NADH pyrophosphatase NudC (nudix superfamily)
MKKFKLAKGQVNYTYIHWAPVINCVLEFQGKILIVQRNKNLNFYPNYYNGISGFLDDNKSLEEKVRNEIKEELSLKNADIKSITLGNIFHQKASKYNKTWIVHPILVRVKTNKIKLDWEAQNFKWIDINDASKYKLLPGFNKVLAEIKTLLP